MKKITMFLVLVLSAMLLIGCDDPVEYSFEVEAEKSSVRVGESINIYADTDKPSPVFSFESSDDAIATVDSYGIMKGVSVGEVTIKVTLEGVGNKSVKVNVVEKDMLASELKAQLTEVLGNYINAKNGSIKIEVVEGGKTSTSETIFNYNNDGSLKSLMYKAVTEDTTEIYVKDGFSYVNANGEKLKKELTEQEEETITSKYSHVEFLVPATGFYTENDTFNTLNYVGREGDAVVFSLDLSRYNGEVFNIVGVGEILVKATIVNSKLTKVSVVVTEVAQTKSITVEYRSFGSEQTINYPADLNSYVG